MAAVTFLVVGAQKCGTTALHAYLREHPELFLPELKELHFFDDEEIYARPDPDHGAYESLFAGRRPGQLAGEVTPIYMFWPPSAERIRRYNPGMKAIFVLRNPIERAYANWNMEFARGEDTRDFWTAITSPEPSPDSRGREVRYLSYLARGRYAEQLRRWWSHFPADQTLVLRHEDLADSPRTVLRAITDFLGVAPFAPTERRMFTGAYDRPMRPDEWAYLRDAFTAEIRSLEELLGWDCSAWLEPPGGDAG